MGAMLRIRRFNNNYSLTCFHIRKPYNNNNNNTGTNPRQKCALVALICKYEI